MSHWFHLTLALAVIAGCNGASDSSIDRRCNRHHPCSPDASVDSSPSQTPDASAPKPDAAAPQPDAATMADAAVPQPDAFVPLPDASTGGGGGTGPTYPTQHPKIY